MSKQRDELIGQIRKGRYAQHFENHPGVFGSLTTSDLGKYFSYRGHPFVLLGAHLRARKYKLVCHSPLDDSTWKFTVGCVERALREEFTAKVRRRYERSKQRYAKYAVSNVRSVWMEGVQPHAIYPHGCFYRAYRYATDLVRLPERGIRLVHGQCTLALGPHAWVELPDGLVFDGVLQQFYLIEDWEEEILGQAWYKYTPSAAALILANMPVTHDGQRICQWDAELKLPWFSGVPLEIDLDKAWELIVASGIREEANNQDSVFLVISCELPL
jgi:hypothetical protein